MGPGAVLQAASSSELLSATVSFVIEILCAKSTVVIVISLFFLIVHRPYSRPGCHCTLSLSLLLSLRLLLDVIVVVRFALESLDVVVLG